MSRVCVLLAAAAMALAGCGASNDAAEPVVEITQRPSTEVPGTEWQLVGVRQAGVTVPTRPNLDVTFVVRPKGRFLLRSCNNLFGDVVFGASTATFDAGSTTRRICPGAAGEVEHAVRSALEGVMEWKAGDRQLWLTNAANDVRLEFRVKDPAQPPVSAVLVATVPGTALGCRIMAGVAEGGERLYALARIRAGGPWRLVRSGPVAPGDGPLLAWELLDSASGRQCTAGFAPPETARVGYQARPDAEIVDLDVHRVAGIATPIYTGLLDPIRSAEPGRLRAYDTAGNVLAVWAVVS